MIFTDTRTYTCETCGYNGTAHALSLHSCEIGTGRCEDYPCCGHTDGDGCQTLPEHTSEYWMNLRQQNPEMYDYYDEVGWPGED